MKKTSKMLAIMVILAMLISYFVPLTAFAVDKEISITVNFQSNDDANEGCVQYTVANDNSNWINLKSGTTKITYDSEDTVRIRIVPNSNYRIDWTATSYQATIGETAGDSVSISNNAELQERFANGYGIDASVTAFSLEGVEFAEETGSGDPVNPQTQTDPIDVHFPNAKSISENVVTFTIDDVDYTATVSGEGASFGTKDAADAEILYVSDTSKCTFTISDNFDSETLEVRITSKVDGWNGVLAVNSYTASLNGINFPSGGLDFAIQKISNNGGSGNPTDPQTNTIDIHFPNAKSIEDNVITYEIRNGENEPEYTVIARVSGDGAHFGSAQDEETDVLYVTNANNVTFTFNNDFDTDALEILFATRKPEDDWCSIPLAINVDEETGIKTASLGGNILSGPGDYGYNFNIQRKSQNPQNPQNPINVPTPELKEGYLVITMEAQEGASGSVNYFFKDSQNRWLTNTGAVIGGENVQDNQKEPAGEIKLTDETKEVAIPANVDKIYLGVLTGNNSNVIQTTLYSNDKVENLNKDLLIHTKTYEYDYTTGDKVGLAVGIEYLQDENLYVPEEKGTYLNVNFMGDTETIVKYWDSDSQENSLTSDPNQESPISIGRIVKLQIPEGKLASIYVDVFDKDMNIVNTDIHELTTDQTGKDNFDNWMVQIINGHEAELNLSSLNDDYSFVFNVVLRDPMEPYYSHTLTWNNMKGSGWEDDTLIDGGKARIVQAYKNGNLIWDVNTTYPDSCYDVDNEGHKTDKFIYGEIANCLDNGYPLYEFDVCQSEDGGEVHAVAGVELIVEFTPNYGKQLVAVSMGETAGNAQGTAKYYKVTMPANHVHFNAQFENVDNEKLIGSDTSVSGMEYSLESGALDSGTAVLSIDRVNNLSDTQKSRFADEAGENYEVSTYLDVDLTQVWFKGTNAQFNGNSGYSSDDVWTNEIYDLGDKKATITITLDEGISPDDVIILHELHDNEGNVTGYEKVNIISKNKDDNGIWTLTFETSKFSNYAIAERKDGAPETFDVTFNTDGGSKITTQTVESGEKATKPTTDPKKSGFVFGGWFEDSTCKVEFDFNTPITKTTTLYAKWTEETSDTRIEITEINLTLKAPKVGDEIKTVEITDGNSGYITSNIPPVVTADSDANYTVDYTAWVNGIYKEYGEGFDELFEGTIEENKYYYATISISAKDGYKLTNSTLDNTKINGEAPAEVFNIYDDGNNTYFIAKVKSELDYDVIPDDSSSETLQATEEVSKLISKIVNGENVAGIDSTLKAKVLAAIEAGKDIKVDLTINKVNEEDIASDVQKAKAILGDNLKIGAFYDIDIVLKVDNEILGNVTQLNNKIEIDILIPENLPEVKEGYTRKYSIIKVHGGVAEKLVTEEKNGKAVAKTNEFSTYALAYEDVENATNSETNNTNTTNGTSPKTGDSIFVYVVMLATGIIGISLTRKTNNRTKTRKH